MQTLLTSLHRLPDIVVLFLIVAALGGFAAAAPFAGRLVLRLPDDDTRHAAALDAFKAVLAMAGVVLAFALVEANGNLHKVEGIVAREGAALAATDRALLRSGIVGLAEVRPLLAAYGNAIVGDEWPKLALGRRSEVTDDAYNALSRQARAANPVDARQQAMFTELLKSLDDLADLREQRIADSDADLPAFFWTTTLGLLLIALALALVADATLAAAVSLGATAAAVALLFAFVIIVDQPFEGETSVKAKEIVTALALNAKRR